MKGPAVPPGRRIASQARTIDLLPTVLHLLGMQIPRALQGVSLVPSFTGGPVETSYSYAEALYPKLNMGWAELRSIRTNRWKYVRAPRPELYDLEKDPRETANVIRANRPVELELQKVLAHITSGAGKTDQVRIRTISPATEKQLEALGYVSAGLPRSVQLTGRGIDPKDRVHILELLERSASRNKTLSPEQRLNLLRKAREEDASNPLLCYLLGRAYESRGRLGEALDVYRSAAERRSTATSRIYGRMGVVYGEQGRLDEAVAALQKAIEMDPTDIDLHDKLALAYLLAGRLTEAEELLKFLLEVDEENSQAHNNMGWIASRRGKSKLARAPRGGAVQFRESLVSPSVGFTKTAINLP